jgi:cation diffusion facilitator CzcD-associated flavoprotein CzcO
MMPEHFDVIVVGAGLSGIDAAYHLRTSCRDKSFVILESRDAIGRWNSHAEARSPKTPEPSTPPTVAPLRRRRGHPPGRAAMWG